ncbi:SDR family NAD(P)-dependent oxidoreductase [Pollutimonas bauzanensis]|uniref:3-oxoacyl-[acyl-carrier protein] reductase n=1 Tax=Pollutimonas bauzanensis TaxID=658167 RepID=A0A1M5UME9_9BURK|nr:SDR family NAD(P)-dependent oxidoreductase [Pollutimonas bauzanensis]SHH64100.1 3-oxoacyl-[acyl-carrier protein] reductase [Pollutimonas bauzanensis]
MQTLKDKVAVVTGSGRGIGCAIAKKLASHGARVIVNDLDAAFAQQTVDEIRAAGGVAEAFVGSVVEESFGQRLVDKAIDCFGGLDIIINNAGYTWDGVIQKMSDEQWQAMLDVHITAPFRVLRAAANFIREASRQENQAGQDIYRKVVNISSTSGIMGNAGQANYSAAKAGIAGLTRALAKEWARYKVNVNSVAFGLISTRLTDEPATAEGMTEIDGHMVKIGTGGDARTRMLAAIPMGRAGTVEEAAGAVYLFCLPESNYISGQTVICGGGRP